MKLKIAICDDEAFYLKKSAEVVRDNLEKAGIKIFSTEDIKTCGMKKIINEAIKIAVGGRRLTGNFIVEVVKKRVFVSVIYGLVITRQRHNGKA